jgi:hypothetical protein
MGPTDPTAHPPLSDVFTPGAPVVDPTHFVGRASRLQRAMHVLDEPGRHLLVLGEAGVGRTSFARMAAGQRPLRYHQAGPGDSFDLLMARLLGTDPEQPADGRHETWRLVDHPERPAPVLLLDDVDRASPRAVAEGIAPLLRALADAGSDTKLILVASRDRPFPDALAGAGLRLYAIGLDRMAPDSLAEIITAGARRLGLSVTAELRDRMVADSDGLPAVVHALCLEAARSAQARGSRRLTLGRDYLPALTALVDSLAPRLDQIYEEATAARGQHNRYAHVLWAGALCAGPSFELEELERLLAHIESQPVPRQAYVRHLGDLVKRGLLARVREGLYRFADPALRVYVRLRLRMEAPGLMGEDPLQLALRY